MWFPTPGCLTAFPILIRILGEARGPPRVEDPSGAPPGGEEAAVTCGVVRHKLPHFWLGPSYISLLSHFLCNSRNNGVVSFGATRTRYKYNN